MKRQQNLNPSVAGSLLVSAVLLFGCGAAEQATSVPPRPVAWTTVQAAAPVETRIFNGSTRAAERSELSFEVPGLVETVAFEIGETFNAGDVLATLNERRLKLSVLRAEGDLAEVNARLVEAERDFSRQETLFKNQVSSRSQLDDARAKRDSERSRLAAAEALRDQAQEDLSDTELLAPYDGRIAARHIEPSQVVAAGQTVLEIQGVRGGLEIEVSVPETVVDRLEIGSEHVVRFPAYEGIEQRARITQVASRAATRNAYPVTLVLDEPSDDLRAGKTAEVHIALAAPSGNDEAPPVLIPLTAFVPTGSREGHVFVIDRQAGTIREQSIVPVRVGERHVAVDGLSEGDLIVEKGVRFLRDGQEVAMLGDGPDRYNP